MMSEAARSLFLNGDKGSGLAAWKVGAAGVEGLGRSQVACLPMPLERSRLMSKHTCKQL